MNTVVVVDDWLSIVEAVAVLASKKQVASQVELLSLRVLLFHKSDGVFLSKNLLYP